MSEKLPPFPPEFRDNREWSLAVHYEQAYEHALAFAAAYAARLHTAVKALRHIDDMIEDKGIAMEALELIGELPELPPLPPLPTGTEER